jgi:CheY-like chemotaxis protein
MNESSERFELLRSRYASSLADKHRHLARAWAAFVAAVADAATRIDLQQQLHRLCGSAHAYGYGRLGDHACAADNLMRQWEASSPALRIAPADLLDRLAAPMQAVLAELGQAHADALEGEAAAESVALRVLLVEDDPGQALAISAQLEERGCVVRSEAGADLLWQALTLWPCHAVVLDYWLRGETATDAVATLRREPRFAQIALVCFSVERDPQILRAVLDAGCDAVVAKAEGTDRLLDVVRDCVARPDRSGRLIG